MSRWLTCAITPDRLLVSWLGVLGKFLLVVVQTFVQISSTSVMSWSRSCQIWHLSRRSVLRQLTCCTRSVRGSSCYQRSKNCSRLRSCRSSLAVQGSSTMSLLWDSLIWVPLRSRMRRSSRRRGNSAMIHCKLWLHRICQTSSFYERRLRKGTGRSRSLIAQIGQNT